MSPASRHVLGPARRILCSRFRGPGESLGETEDGKGALFWRGYENGEAVGFAAWMFSAFQHGGKWDVDKVCCVTMFSYRKRQFSTSLGDGDKDEGVAGYLVEYGE